MISCKKHPAIKHENRDTFLIEAYTLYGRPAYLIHYTDNAHKRAVSDEKLGLNDNI